jgi:hypothetical protein
MTDTLDVNNLLAALGAAHKENAILRAALEVVLDSDAWDTDDILAAKRHARTVLDSLKVI